MKAAGVFLGVIVALALQTTVVPFLWSGKSNLDLVLVVVVYTALQFGPTSGLLRQQVSGPLDICQTSSSHCSPAY